MRRREGRGSQEVEGGRGRREGGRWKGEGNGRCRREMDEGGRETNERRREMDEG